MKSVEVKKGTMGDVWRVARVNRNHRREEYQERWDPLAWLHAFRYAVKDLGGSRDTYLAINNGKKVVSTAVLTEPVTALFDGKEGPRSVDGRHFIRAWTHPDYRNRNLFTSLMDKVLEEHGDGPMPIIVITENPRMRKILSNPSRGFVKVGTVAEGNKNKEIRRFPGRDLFVRHPKKDWWEKRRLLEKAKLGYGLHEPGMEKLPKRFRKRVEHVAEHKLRERRERER